jgi:hypothetical protein
MIEGMQEDNPREIVDSVESCPDSGSEIQVFSQSC